MTTRVVLALHSRRPSRDCRGSRDSPLQSGAAMASRSDRLDRLVVRSECTTSWERMEGDGARRFCAQCHRSVVDLAQMTPREIEAQLVASGGTLCVRITRRDGRLVTAPEPEPLVDLAVPASRRPSALAAGLVTALLTAAPA